MAGVNAQNIKLGPCKVVFGTGADKIEFGTTKGGVVLTYEETSREVTMDQTGTTPLKEIITGRTAAVAVPFGEYDQEKLLTVLPGSRLVVDTTDPTKKKVVVNATKVIDLLGFAKQMTLIPLAEGTTPNDYVTLPFAAPRANLNYTFDYDNELITNITFKGFPNENGDLIEFGDPDVA
ncbi:hypothetical protein HP548_02940 [Paenibacillus taichungensis]|uniref:Phage tail protein n=1 Tax=Paenibacillus taichungensis TaxID=484184 RepID=A0ABX2MIH9_9BACL|nr:hypothetical protein [Paenibacillus taichungensis]NUU53053.1 hypothetical protein [Paenibacillus taichungensis]